MLTRRELFVSAGACALAGELRAAQTGGPSVRYRDYSRCLPDYLRLLADAPTGCAIVRSPS